MGHTYRGDEHKNKRQLKKDSKKVRAARKHNKKHGGKKS